MARHDELLAEIKCEVESLKVEVRAVKGEVKVTRETVIRLDTAFNGGPGTWHICQSHVEDLRGLKDAMKFVERKIWAGMGILSLLVMLTGLFGPAIAQRIGITPTPQRTQQGQRPQQQKSPALPTNTP